MLGCGNSSHDSASYGRGDGPNQRGEEIRVWTVVTTAAAPQSKTPLSPSVKAGDEQVVDDNWVRIRRLV